MYIKRRLNIMSVTHNVKNFLFAEINATKLKQYGIQLLCN